MSFRRLESFAQLEKAYAGLLEPIEDQTTPIDRDEFDLIIVPGSVLPKPATGSAMAAGITTDIYGELRR
ncbi:hypothetical protein LR69_00573 [Geobacillus sp. BCO2]|nr:hypothetical protein LR69_00573 [Geobacillus sp. BCO2]